jgi:hypothetical protein
MKIINATDKSIIKQIFEAQNYTNDILLNNYLIYDILGDNTISASLRVPFLISEFTESNIPFVELSISFIFRIKEFNPNIRSYLNFFASRFPELISPEFKISHTLEGFDKEKFTNIVNQFIPDSSYPNLYYRQYLRSVRDKIFDNRKEFFKIDGIWAEETEKLASLMGFKPTEGLPVELKNGIPKENEIRSIFYESKQKENMIIEHGFFSYYGDHFFKNTWIRIGLESYSIYLLYKLYEDNINLLPILASWIFYARNIIVRIEDVFNTYINEKDFLPINLQDYFSKDISNMALFRPQLSIENDQLNKTDLVQRDMTIFNSPPTSFEELIALNLFRQADIMFSNKAVAEALRTYAKSLMILTKKNHSKGTVNILRKLAAVAKRTNNMEQAAKYLNNALEQAKKGGVTLETIFRVQLELGNIYSAMKNHEDAHQQYNIVYSFMRSYKGQDLGKFEALALIYMARNYTDIQNYSEAFKIFSRAQVAAEKNPEVYLDFVIEKAKYFDARKKPDREIYILTRGTKLKGKVDPDKMSEILIRLGYLFLYIKNKPDKTINYLTAAEQLLTKNNQATMRRKIKLYEILSDAFKQAKEFQKFRLYADQAKILRKKLEESS